MWHFKDALKVKSPARVPQLMKEKVDLLEGKIERGLNWAQLCQTTGSSVISNMEG
ncbi:MAG: hypothetical protein JWL59_4695 [Chthoniobacteraceae bacterium]|nr:hypothetical protein [Chthoniobacteraceae bacterium]